MLGPVIVPDPLSTGTSRGSARSAAPCRRLLSRDGTEQSMAPRIEKLSVRNLRSIGDDRVTLRFPDSGVLVLLGECRPNTMRFTIVFL